MVHRIFAIGNDSMKRLHHFGIDIRSEADSGAPVKTENLIHFDSWHKTWKRIQKELNDTKVPFEALVIDPKTKRLVASFTLHNQQNLEQEDTDSEQEVPRLWETDSVEHDGEFAFFCNRNVADFEWMLLEGARHDVPFQLGFLERKANRSPNGIYAYLHQMFGQWRDMFTPVTNI